MEIVVDIGLLWQIFGVLLVLLAQVRFVYRVWRKYGDMRKWFLKMLQVMRMGDEEMMEWSNEKLEEKFPEKWALASYLREDIWTTAIGLVVTLIGLLFELSKLTLVLVFSLCAL